MVTDINTPRRHCGGLHTKYYKNLKVGVFVSQSRLLEAADRENILHGWRGYERLDYDSFLKKYVCLLSLIPLWLCLNLN